MNDSRKVRYMNDLILRIVRQIQDLQEEIGAPAFYGQSVSAKSVSDRLDDMLQVEDPGGKTGTLTADENGGLSIFLGSRIRGMREISTRPGGFNGVVWSEEMDRASREDDE